MGTPKDEFAGFRAMMGGLSLAIKVERASRHEIAKALEQAAAGNIDKADAILVAAEKDLLRIVSAHSEAT